MRRFLVIVLLSYFTAYFYLDITFWNKNNTPQYAGSVVTEPNVDNLEVAQNQQNAYLTEKKPAGLKLLSE